MQQFECLKSKMIAIALLLFVHYAFSQNLSAHIQNLYSQTSQANLPIQKRLEICQQLIADAKQQLPAASNWHIRFSIECADRLAEAGDNKLAIAKITDLIQVIRQNGTSPRLEVIALIRRAVIYSHLAENEKTIADLEAALLIAANHGVELMNDVRIHLVGAYSRVGRNNEAIELAEATLVSLKLNKGDAAAVAIVNHALGSALTRREKSDDYERAFIVLKAAHEDFIKIHGEDSTRALQSKQEIAYVLSKLGKHAEALALAQAVLERRKTLYGSEHQSTKRTLSLIDVINLQAKRFSSVGSAQQTHISDSEIPLSSQLARKLVIAINHLSQGKNPEALSELKNWAAGVESLRQSSTLQAIDLANFSKQWNDGFLYLAIAEARHGRLRAGLASIEMRRARVLDDTLASMGALQSLEAQDRSAYLRYTREAARQHQQASLFAIGSVGSIRANQRAIEQENFADSILHTVQNKKIQRDYQTLDTSIQRVNQLLVSLGEDEAYLSIAHTRSKDDIFMIHLVKRGVVHATSKPLTPMPNLEKTILAMRMLSQYGSKELHARSSKIVAISEGGYELVNINDPREIIPNYKLVVDYFSDRLIKPFANHLIGTKKLIISADGLGWMIPYDLLELESQPLFQNYTIRLIPSIALWFRQTIKLKELKTSLQQAPQVLALGGANYQRTVRLSPNSPIFINKISATQTPSTYDLSLLAKAKNKYEFFGQLLSMTQGIGELPGSRKEVEEIRRLYGYQNTTLLVADTATEKRVAQLAEANLLTKYNILHFAAHSIAQTDRPLLSAIITGIDDRDSEHDGYISAQEIIAWQLKPSLVILSSCDSAIGPIIGGEGVLGLPYAFLIAGAAMTVQTLWPIPDAKTADWVSFMHQQFLHQHDMPEAIASMKRMAATSSGWTNSYELPSAWAAFTLYSP
jgi:CHAT domain-containing protein